ncbi:DnaJ family domain-containing protein [Pseudonocardia saturnea]
MDRPYESAVDRAIREAAERGAFENLPGKGKPLPHLDDDELGWVRRWMDREGVSPELLLPPSVQLRKEIDRLPETLAALRTEAAVREHVREVNLRVVEHLRFPSGPRIPVRPVDADAAVARWRAARAGPVPPVPVAPTPEPRPRWWRRRGR